VFYYADLKAAIPEEIAHDFLSKLHYVSEALEEFDIPSTERNRVRFRLHPGNEAKADFIAAQIAEVAQKMSRAYRRSESKALVSRLRRDCSFDQDPHRLLIERGELFEYGAGRYGLGPYLVRLIEFFDRELSRMAKKFSAPPFQFPSLVGADALDRCKYIRSFPHSLTFVSHLREDLDLIQEFARAARWNGEDLECPRESLSRIECLLAPSVCFHWYAWLRDSRLLEPRSITAIGKCFRYESGNLKTLERLWDFTMREIIFVGPREFVLDQRQKAVDDTVTLFDEWGLSFEIKSATDPFFIEDYSSQTIFQSAFELKYEARASLPYKGDTLAVGSFNYHQDFFGRSFNISGESGEALHTSCVGFGLERLALAFLAQYGLDLGRWPEAVAAGIER
jgi:seryl-tRNA synthetase